MGDFGNIDFGSVVMWLLAMLVVGWRPVRPSSLRVPGWPGRGRPGVAGRADATSAPPTQMGYVVPAARADRPIHKESK